MIHIRLAFREFPAILQQARWSREALVTAKRKRFKKKERRRGREKRHFRALAIKVSGRVVSGHRCFFSTLCCLSIINVRWLGSHVLLKEVNLEFVKEHCSDGVVHRMALLVWGAGGNGGGVSWLLLTHFYRGHF